MCRQAQIKYRLYIEVLEPLKTNPMCSTYGSQFRTIVMAYGILFTLLPEKEIVFGNTRKIELLIKKYAFRYFQWVIYSYFQI